MGCCRNRRKRIVGIKGIAIKKMFGVVDDFLAMAYKIRHAIGNHTDIFVTSGFEYMFDVQHRAFAHQGDNRRIGG